MSDETAPGIWNGPFVGELANGQTVQPGDQANDLTAADLQSAHWQSPSAPPAPAPAFSSFAPATDEEPS